MKLKYAYITLILLISSACEKLDTISTPDFNVRIDTTTFRAGEEVLFRFSGDAGMITFFSGEVGFSYIANDDNQIERMTIQFESHNQENVIPEPSDASTFRVMLSTDFKSLNTHYAGVMAANWIDITDRFTLSGPGSWNAANYVQSGARSIMDVVDSGTPFYVAFHYEVPERESTGNLTRRWRMHNFQLVGHTTNSSDPFVASTYSPDSWTLISRDGPGTSASEAAASSVLFAPLTAGSQASVEEWLVSPQFSINDEQTIRSFGEGIKGYGNPTMTDFMHVYEEPGTYTATFVAVNENVEGRHEVVRQVRVIVLP